MSRGSKTGPNAPVDSGVSLAGLLPMLLSNRKVRPFEDAEFLTEIKYDGYRLLAEFEPGRTELKTRGGADATRWFPEVVTSLSAMSRGRNIVDGEVCVLDRVGRSDFDLLHERALRRRPACSSSTTSSARRPGCTPGPWELMMEGVVAKRADSPYLPGERTEAWLTLKRPGAVPAGRFSRRPTG